MRWCFKHIDRFVRLRRFENFSLKEATHNLQSRNFPPDSSPAQTLPPESSDVDEKLHDRSGACQSNTENRGKVRREHPNRLALRQRMLDDWIYWIFTQLVMPLSAISLTFHQTPQIQLLTMTVFLTHVLAPLVCVRVAVSCVVTQPVPVWLR
eukprot:COSAG02_NODE_27861_length_601_cov_0.832669_1_plen_151_part_01